MNVLGIMSGSSLDGFDLALCNFSYQSDLKWSVLKTETYPLDDQLKDQLKDLYRKPLSEVLEVDLLFNKTLNTKINSFVKNLKFKIDLIATHGHTVCHIPEENKSFQLGNGGILSSLTRINVVSDFRIQDVTIGGAGTPLIPVAERDLFAGYDYYLNLGGIANITHVSNGIYSAYDIAPCNQVLNYLSGGLGFEFDKDGLLAREGKLDDNMVNTWLEEDYFKIKGPKSLDNNWIVEYWIPHVLSKSVDIKVLLRSYVHLLSTLIGNEIKQNKPSKMLVTGGGANNIFLIEEINKQLSKLNVELVVPPREIVDFKEAILMAYMGYLRTKESHNILKQVTGANMNLSAGAIYLKPND